VEAEVGYLREAAGLFFPQHHVFSTIAHVSDRDRLTLPIEAATDLASEGYWSLAALYGNASPRTTPEQRAAHLLNPGELAGSLEMMSEEIESFGS
jgi:hypothetical protein